MQTRFGIASLALLSLTGCQLAVATFTAPTTVLADQVFSLSLTLSVSSPTAGSLGAVLQLPNGFGIVGAPIPSSPVLTRDDPALLGLYTAEPGHYLASWSLLGDPSLLYATNWSLVLRAPSQAGPFTVKVALAGQPLTQAWQSSSPVGVTNFAAITAAPNARVVTVVTVPSTDFESDTLGLPFGASQQPPRYGVVLHDLDGDGDDDLATPGRAFLRFGDRWVESSAGLFVPVPYVNSLRIAAGDFDGDGFADLAYGDGRVFFGDGGSNWTPVPQLTGGAPTAGVSVGDFDGDGRDDLVLAARNQNRLSAYRGNANRTFTLAGAGLPSTTAAAAEDVLIADVTGDGLLDIVFDQVYAGDGAGNWSLGVGMSGNTGLGSAVVAVDLDGDGVVEVLHANEAQGIRVHRHLGGNSWQFVGTIQAQAHSLAALDYDRDGWNDLVIGTFGTAGVGLQLWRNLGAYQLVLVPNSGLPAAVVSPVEDIAIGDLDGDTWPDIAVAHYLIGVAAYHNWRGGTSPFGAPCDGLASPLPVVSGIGDPTLGNTNFAIRLDGGAPGGLTLLWFGTSRSQWGGQPVLPLDLGLLGAPGCTLWTDPAQLTVGVGSATGSWSQPLPIPNQASLRFVTVFAQGAVAAPGANPLGLATSAGLAVRIP
jgi:hypothetical protein